MCEILLRVVDKTNPADAEKDIKLLKRGDVVAVCPDGWPWGREELINPDWRIIKFPGIATKYAEPFTGPELATDPNTPAQVLRRRGFSFDIDSAALPGNFKTWLADSARFAPTYTINLTAQQLAGLKIPKAR